MNLERQRHSECLRRSVHYAKPEDGQPRRELSIDALRQGTSPTPRWNERPAAA